MLRVGDPLMPLDLFGDLFELCLDLNPKSGTEGPNGISITHHQDQDQDQDQDHGFEYTD